MTFYAFSALLNALAATTLGIFVYSRDPRNPKHLAYGLYCLSLSLWSGFYFAWQMAESREAAMLLARLLMVGAILIPVFYFQHTLTMLSLVARHRTLLRAGYALAGLFLLSDLTPWFIADVRPEMAFRFWPKPGPLFHLFLVCFVLYVSYATYLLIAAFRKAKGIQRNQYLYLVMGAIIGYAGGATNFPLWYGIQIPPSGTILVTVYTTLVAYTIIRFRLFDFSLVMEKSLAYLLPTLSVAIPSLLILLAVQEAYFDEVSYQFSAIFLGLFVLAVSMAYVLQSGVQTVIAKTLFRHRHDMYETLSEFPKALVAILDRKSLTDQIVRTLAEAIAITSASLYLLDKEKGAYVLASAHGLNPDGLLASRLQAGEGLPAYLAETKTILVKEEVEQAAPTSPTRPLAPVLAALDSDVCIPLVNQDRLIGFCNLGPRTDHRMYSAEDLRLLMTLGQNAAIALDNAMLYEDLKRSQALMRRTDRLRSLEIIAGGFAHEIRNPLTSIKTFIQLAHERKDDEEFMGTFSAIVADDVTRIERLIQEILDYARYMEPKFTEEDLNDIISSCLYFIEVKADSKGIAIEKDLAPDLPMIMVDRQQLKQVLLNLFLNAMDAMEGTGGRLAVRTHRLTKGEETWVQIEVADTGSGIPADSLEHIFDPFFTTKHESAERVGTGLGLTIVHQIVKEHRGSIEVDSTVGAGTTFLVNLPVSPVPCGPSQARRTHDASHPLG